MTTESGELALKGKGPRLLIAGGGTGGHLFPALAVAEAWEADGGEVLFVGTREGLEYRLLPRLNKHLETLKVGRIKGAGLKGRLLTLLGLPLALWSAITIVRRFKPVAVLGMGGFASAPAVAAAWLLRIPTALHEQNAWPGLTNRWLGRFVKRVFISFPDAALAFIGCDTQVSGNPVRAQFRQSREEGRSLTAEGGDDAFKLLVFGGSQGASIFGQVVPEALAALKKTGEIPLKIKHQARKEDVEALKGFYQREEIEAEVLPFIEDMAGSYRQADLVICRAGATTIAELAAMGQAALLIPYPWAADDHQTANALALASPGGAWVCPQDDFSPGWLRDFLLERHNDPKGLELTGAMARKLDNPHAAREIVQELRGLAGESFVTPVA
ncbi:MAG: undecaprenyldiphospho-muramoylpentapeptide beta-N-acetylglucosaminyltransferase [Magnetococcales bacterium]|nr:undecaprenyldiphospho-muramoylpentapeptide beta-N-acetylglucosaminyltransferase [Magnetococcales bacterium]